MRKNNKLIQNQEDVSETSDYISIFNQLFNILLHLFEVWNKRESHQKKRQITYKDDTADNSNPKKKKKKKTRNLTDNDNNISFCEISTPLMDLVCKRNI